MKRFFLITLAALTLAACNSGNTVKTDSNVTEATKGAIVYFNLDEVLLKYDMANDLRSVFETKVESINNEINRRGSKLEKDITAFQDKINKGLLVQSVAQAQQEKLQMQQAEYQNYVNEKNQEIAEENQVMTNQIADAIKNYLTTFNEEKQYAMILTCQGDILALPVAVGDAELDITEEILEGLNAAYVKQKEKENK